MSIAKLQISINYCEKCFVLSQSITKTHIQNFYFYAFRKIWLIVKYFKKTRGINLLYLILSHCYIVYLTKTEEHFVYDVPRFLNTVCISLSYIFSQVYGNSYPGS